MSDLIIKLKKPYTFEGETYNEINLENLENLTGLDSEKVEKLHKQRNPTFVGVLSLNVDYQMLMAAKATDLPVEFFKNLPLKYYNAVSMEVMGFLNSGSEE